MSLKKGKIEVRIRYIYPSIPYPLQQPVDYKKKEYQSPSSSVHYVPISDLTHENIAGTYLLPPRLRAQLPVEKAYTSAFSPFSMMGGGLAMFCRKTYRLMNHGSHTVNSCLMKFFVGTEKTSAEERDMSAEGQMMSRASGRFHLRSNSSRVSCLVSLTKQKIINQARRLSPA